MAEMSEKGEEEELSVGAAPAAAAAAPVTGPWHASDTRGRGRVKLRKAEAMRMIAAGITPHLPASQLRIEAPHADAKFGGMPSDPPPRFPAYLIAKQSEKRATGEACLERSYVPRCAIDHAVSYHDGMRHMRKAAPVVLTGSGVTKTGAKAWCASFKRIVALANADKSTGTKFNVMVNEADADRFVDYDASKNVFGSFYHIREPETGRMEMDIPEFVTCANTWTARKLYFDTAIAERLPEQYGSREDNADAGDAIPRGVYTHAGLGESSPLMRSLLGRRGTCSETVDEACEIDWPWIRTLRHVQRLGPCFGVRLLASARGSLRPLHYATEERLLVQALGRSRCVVIPPRHTFNGLYPYPVHHPYDKNSMVDLEDVDDRMWPLFKENVRGSVCYLKPGEALFVPRYHFLHVESLEDENASLSFSFGSGARARSPEQAGVIVSRSLEERLVSTEQIKERDVKFWLGVIRDGEELEWCNLDTVPGYRRVVMAQMVRDAIEEAGEDDSDDEGDGDGDGDVDEKEDFDQPEEGVCLGRGRWRSFLERMLDRRLESTPWLTPRDPLLLKDTPKLLEDTRTEWERKYPEFFRKKLQREGWNVPDAVSTVPIPGVNI